VIHALKKRNTQHTACIMSNLPPLTAEDSFYYPQLMLNVYYKQNYGTEVATFLTEEASEAGRQTYSMDVWWQGQGSGVR
jgi:hypothetical protein